MEVELRINDLEGIINVFFVINDNIAILMVSQMHAISRVHFLG